MSAELKENFSDAEVELIDGANGVFEVTVDGDLIFSKAKLGRFPEDGEVLGLLQKQNQ